MKIIGGGGLDEKKNHWWGGLDEKKIIGGGVWNCERSTPPLPHVFLNGIALKNLEINNRIFYNYWLQNCT